jgi:hypothetical protein
MRRERVRMRVRVRVRMRVRVRVKGVGVRHTVPGATCPLRKAPVPEPGAADLSSSKVKPS